MRQMKRSQTTNNAGVDTAKSNGLDSINNIQPTGVKKDEAKTAIDKAAEAKKAEKKKRKSTKHQTRQTKKKQQQKRKSMRSK